MAANAIPGDEYFVVYTLGKKNSSNRRKSLDEAIALADSMKPYYDTIEIDRVFVVDDPFDGIVTNSERVPY